MEVTIIVPGKSPVRLAPHAACAAYPDLRGPINTVVGLGLGTVVRTGGVVVTATRPMPGSRAEVGKC